MVDQSIAGAAGKVAAEGDRSGRARLVIVLLCLVLALSMFLSLTSGASDASAVLPSAGSVTVFWPLMLTTDTRAFRTATTMGVIRSGDTS